MKTTAIFYSFLLYTTCALAQNLNSIRKNPECRLPEDPGFCTPVTRYGVSPLVYPEITATCVPYAYYGEGGNRGFESFNDCVYTCGTGPLETIVLTGNLNSIRKNPECLLPEDPGFCTPVIRYSTAPIFYPELTSTCIAYPYYGEGGSRGFDSFNSCIYACSKGPLASLVGAG